MTWYNCMMCKENYSHKVGNGYEGKLSENEVNKLLENDIPSTGYCSCTCYEEYLIKYAHMTGDDLEEMIEWFNNGV